MSGTVSDPGHCEHCHQDCQGGRETSEDDPSIIGHDSANEEWAATWMVCPSCAERERIVAWIRTSIGDEADTGELADDIERGAHLEANRG